MNELEDTISEFADSLKELSRTAAERLREGAPLDAIPEDPQVSDQLWDLGLVGARLDQLMKSIVGLHAPVIAAYDPESTDQVDSAEHKLDEDQGQTGPKGPQILRLDFILQGLGRMSPSEAVAIVDHGGAEIYQRLSEGGCEIQEWGSSIEEYEARDN